MTRESLLPDDIFTSLAGRIAAVSGIRVPVTKRWLLAARVSERMQEQGSRDVARYVSDLLDPGGEAELGRLIEALRVGETQFFRHRGQLRAIRRIALPEIAARHEADQTRAVRVWSAGCASGEEAYTLAMMLEDALPASDGWKHDVLATDMSEIALERARAARYPATSAHGVPPAVAAWAIDADGSDVRIAPRVKRVVRFERRNLLEAVYPRGFDIVLCRNVLIYFDRATQREVLARLARSLVPGGYLALGYAEHLRDADPSLVPLRTEDGILYRKLDASVDAAARARAARPAMAQPASPPKPRDIPVRAPLPPREIAPSPAPRIAALRGRLEGEPGARAAREVIASLLAAPHNSPALLDIRELEYADDSVARVLARAAATLEAQERVLVVVAAAPGLDRFLRRHGIAPPARVVRTPEEVSS